MKKSNRLLILVLASLAASNAPAQNPTPSPPPAYVDEAPLPKGWPKPGPYDQVSEKSYPSYRAAFTTENRENGAFQTLFSHIQKNDIPMTAPVEISMTENDGQNLRQTSLAFLYQDTNVGKTGTDGAKIEIRDVPARPLPTPPPHDPRPLLYPRSPKANSFQQVARTWSLPGPEDFSELAAGLQAAIRMMTGNKSR